MLIAVNWPIHPNAHRSLTFWLKIFLLGSFLELACALHVTKDPLILARAEHGAQWESLNGTAAVLFAEGGEDPLV